jgi:Uncharacterised nucleotidyltransferase
VFAGSSRALMREAEVCDATRVSPAIARLQPLSGQASCAEFLPIRAAKSLSRDDRVKDSILQTVNGLSLQDCSWMEGISTRRWRRLLRWMDYHGLALYFFDRLTEVDRSNLLPSEIRDGFERRLEENTMRTLSMIEESIAIQREFQSANLRYALLKGASLSPSSTSRPELRLQFDVDFLVAEKDVQQAQKILVEKGYRLYAIEGRQWEFKRNERPGIGLKDLYRDTGSWRIELHSAAGSQSSDVLKRVEWRRIGGFAMPTLTPVDLFSGQGLHACKHVCLQFCRASYLVEFRRHVLFRHGNEEFWGAVEQRFRGDPHACLRLGVVLALTAEVMGEFAPEALTSWTLSTLSPSIRLWIEMYGSRSVFQNFPGSKNCLLLQEALQEQGLAAKQSVRRSLVPLRLPPLLFRGSPQEGLSMWLKRYCAHFGLVFGRIYFHCVEGARFAWQFRRWRRRLGEVAG